MFNFKIASTWDFDKGIPMLVLEHDLSDKRIMFAKQIEVSRSI